eukprot:g945.t1
MSRKLKKEIELTIKKVHEGFGIYQRLWDKIYDSDDQPTRQKTAAELKRELKKLQRCRDKIKGWLNTPRECRDKLQTLKDIKSDIETKMENFKRCEREVKTKTFSKEGLKNAVEDDEDGRSKEHKETAGWINDLLKELEVQIEDVEAQIEDLRSKKRLKKKEQSKLEDLEEHLENHKWHEEKLEQILRLMDNDALEPEQVNNLKDGLEYYVESNMEP